MIPNTLQPAPGRVILITVPNHWGKGATVAEAKRELRKQGGANVDRLLNGKYWRVHSVHPDTYVDGMGYINAPSDEEPVMLQESNP